ncbi:MAG: acyltransferase domain-containing protein, partial [Proteobacteria bacterium]|nr:acyltransferase domain-containing protein [Pseudomonadota bacterium]
MNRPPLAIVGVSALFPGSLDASGFWNDILAGRDLIQDVPKSHWLLEDYYDEDMTAVDKTYATRGAFLKDVPFDPLEWGVPPSIVPATDTSQLLALIMAKRVLQDASQGQFQDMDTKRMSVILGVTSAQELLGSMNSRLQKPMWKKVLRDSGLPESKVQELLGRIDGEYVPWQEATFPGLLGNVVAGRIANRLDLGGTNCVCDAACASAFSAINMAANELWLGQSDVVITGGVDTMNDIFMFMCFSKTPALSKSGDVKPFSDEADGTMLGEGLGMVAIKRLADAEANGDRIYAVLNGIGASSDGRAKSVYAPRPSGQRLALDRAYANAGYGMDTVEIVEAHGTGTIAGDAAEFEGLKMAFGEAHPDKKQWAALGSVKSQIGHTKAAAGSAGLFKMVMALHHKVLPPTIKVDRPNPKMDLENSPFYLSTRARPWVRGPEHPRRAGVSSFGFGGSNFHLALEEYTGSAEKAFRRRVSETELVVFSADNAQALDAQLAGIELGGAGFLEWFARDSQANFEPKSVRAAIVATDEADLAKQIETLRGHLAKKPGKKLNSPKGLYLSFDAVAGDVGFLFPGQGSQYVDMGAKVAMTWPLALSAWDTAAGIAELTELHDVVFPKPDFSDGSAWQKTLTETQWAQPAIGAASLSLYRLLTAAGVKPAAVGGHSYGEVTALHAAGVLTADDMLRVARKRGELMAEAAKTPGSMTAVVADVADVKPVVEASGLDVVIANHNSPSQAVLSGPTADIDAIEKKLDDAGLSYKRLGVATAFHSSVVSASVEPFAEFLATVDFGEATVPVYANSEAAPYPAGADDKRSILGNQIARGVRFVEQVEAMYAAGIRTFIEVGPHAVLTGLVGKILKGKEFTAVNLDRKGKDGLKALNEALGKLVVAGVEVNLSAFWDGVQPAVDPRSVPAPKMVLKINGANYGKPYPPPEGASALPGPNPEIEPEVIVKEVIKEVVKEVRVEVPVEVPVHVPVAAQPTQAAPVAYAAPVAPASAWVQAFQDSQRQTVEAHAAFQDAMSRSHTAFLESMERSFVQLTGMVTGQAVAAPVMPVAPVVHAVMPQVVAPVAPVIHAPVAATPVQTAVDIDSLLTTPGAPSPVAAPVVAAPVAVAAAPSRDLNQLMLDVVADKTGYPAEMLGLEMTLEGDLGIDSIKRVEILSAMRDAEPSLPEVDAGEMASLQTLGQIVAYMADQMGAVPVASAPVAVAASSSIDLNQLMLDVVADKTGYPAEMLGLEMTLEGDLGIDSIKRVEILSAMRDAEPSLPEVDASEMATLQTLGQIVDYMDAQLGQVSAPVVAAPVAAAPASTANIHQLMLDVVAERTGYPAEMLTMEMSLEGDLGIDSIKRVEILSAMTDAEPTLPEVDASEMASLQTLGQIVDYMNAQMGTTSAPAAAAPVAAASTANIHQLMLDVVAEKTGYPAEMLTM